MLSADEALEHFITNEGIRVTEEDELPHCIDGLYCEFKNNKVICLRPRMSAAKRLCTLAEEYGHAKTSWGDARTMDAMQMSKQEARAIAYAIELVVPLKKLYTSRHQGLRNNCECAEYLGVTEEFLVWVFAYYEARIPGFKEFFMEKDK